LREGADPDIPDKHGWTAVHWAATDTKSDGDFIRLLINEGADIEVQDTLSGWTPLHVAAVKSNLEAATALVDAGAKKGAKSSLGEIPLRCVKREKKNTRLYDLLTTTPRQLDLWPSRWLDSELRHGRGGRGRDDDSPLDDDEEDDEDEEDSSFSRTRDTGESSRNHPHDDKMFDDDDDDDYADDDDYED
jgi:hypothetical protein